MYPEHAGMSFDCPCPVKERKNVWNDITGVHVRYCPMCGERREQFYTPTQKWEDTGRGKAGEPEPDHIKKARLDAIPKRNTVRNPKV